MLELVQLLSNDNFNRLTLECHMPSRLHAVVSTARHVTRFPLCVSDNCVLLTLERSLSSGRMLFRRQDFHNYWNDSVEQFAARRETVRLAIRPVQAVTEDFWTMRPWRSVNSFNCAIQKYSYLLNHLLTCLAARFSLVIYLVLSYGIVSGSQY